jgi:hypothetical protein
MVVADVRVWLVLPLFSIWLSSVVACIRDPSFCNLSKCATMNGCARRLDYPVLLVGVGGSSYKAYSMGEGNASKLSSSLSRLSILGATVTQPLNDEPIIIFQISDMRCDGNSVSLYPLEETINPLNEILNHLVSIIIEVVMRLLHYASILFIDDTAPLTYNL